MGSRAMALFEECGIRVVTGAPDLDVETRVKSFLEGSLVTGGNVCNH
jgi:predicted Fe-Mo cluster-binding NifX family protein